MGFPWRELVKQIELLPEGKPKVPLKSEPNSGVCTILPFRYGESVINE